MKRKFPHQKRLHVSSLLTYPLGKVSRRFINFGLIIHKREFTFYSMQWEDRTIISEPFSYNITYIVTRASKVYVHSLVRNIDCISCLSYENKPLAIALAQPVDQQSLVIEDMTCLFMHAQISELISNLARK